jgi:serine/threonine protein kinase
MNAALWTEIREIFGELVELSASERAARLSTLHPDLRNRVEGLLSAHDSAGHFLERDREPIPGIRLGPYRLIERIGEGGMGVVFRAARDDGEFRREVAIKVVGGRLLGPEAERRFIQERQILARLDHLNIVRMFDGGLSDGRRFLAMEYVKGEPITSFCKRIDLPLTKRLRLFLDLAAAVHYAHQNLIIHRDLKATNVLVTEDGIVKVLDFGIAQLMETGEQDSALRTGTNPWTLACASPEQLMGVPLTVGTDIYSLGLLLYELLTGVNPQWSSGDRFNEACARICEHDPKPPSHLNDSIPRDLDAIVLKTLAKSPQDRYGSVEELRADVQRFLDGRPVLAQAPSVAYQVSKMLKRNKLLSVVSARLILAVLVGLVAFAWQARVAEQQRVIVERRFTEARRLIRTVIADIQPKMAAIPGTATVRKTLIERTLTYLEALERDASGNPDLLRELADS